MVPASGELKATLILFVVDHSIRGSVAHVQALDTLWELLQLYNATVQKIVYFLNYVLIKSAVGLDRTIKRL